MAGAAALVEAGSIAVVVDVLSFSTTATVAVELGAVVHPHRWRDDSAARRAEQLAATLAVGRLEARDGPPGAVSLSPVTIRQAAPERLLLPSPNGSTIVAALADAGATVLVGALRNASAVAQWIDAEVAASPRPVIVIPAGEQWPSGALRPAVEDLWGAGAIVSGLRHGPRSVEAQVAADAFAAVRHDLPAVLRECAGGRELHDAGFGADVAVAAELDTSEVVPVLTDGALVDARRAPAGDRTR
nr:2-phosphosulfolactate phosphatase [Flexivirga aerilata]